MTYMGYFAILALLNRSKAMATSKSNVVQIATADAAFKRVKPLLDRLRDDIKAAADVVSREYDALPKLEKTGFAEQVENEYGWSRDRLSTFARIGRDFPEKAKLISSRSSAIKIDETSTNVMTQIVRTSDEDLIKARDAGMFDVKVSGDDIRRFRKTGQLPKVKETPAPKTDLQKIRAEMERATQHMQSARKCISNILAIMETCNVHDAKGRQATALIKEFEKLCTEMAAANPTTSERSFKILRGEA